MSATMTMAVVVHKLQKARTATASKHWQRTILSKALSAMRPTQAAQSNLFADAVYAKHWHLRKLRLAWEKLTPMCVWRVMTWRAMKRQAETVQPDLTAVPTMQLIAALNSECKEAPHETASKKMADELEDAGSLAKRPAQHKRAAAYWTRQQLTAAWTAMKTGCTMLQSPGTPDTCYAVAAAECEAAQ